MFSRSQIIRSAKRRSLENFPLGEINWLVCGTRGECENEYDICSKLAYVILAASLLIWWTYQRIVKNDWICTGIHSKVTILALMAINKYQKWLALSDAFVLERQDCRLAETIISKNGPIT